MLHSLPDFSTCRIAAVAVIFGYLMTVSVAPAYGAPPNAEETKVSATEKRFATVVYLHGAVAATKAGAAQNLERTLRKGDVVYVGETLRSAATGEAVLKTDDAGMVAIRPNTEMVAEFFAADDKPSDGITLRLLVGSLRLISGWISQTNRPGSTVVTPTSTIGIRGTDHEPYVLSPEMALKTTNPEGTYDKVNRGETALLAGGNALPIGSGQVGFVRTTRPDSKSRALMTLVLPVLLEKVPSFYLPGTFDAELDLYSSTAGQESLRQLEERRNSPRPIGLTDCSPTTIATNWLKQLDSAIERHDVAAVVGLFAPATRVQAHVLDRDGKSVSVDLSRDEFAQSTTTALKTLSGYKQHRMPVTAVFVGENRDPTCRDIALSSAVTEEGSQSGKPYRFESREDYELTRLDGKWLAVKAETTQK